MQLKNLFIGKDVITLLEIKNIYSLQRIKELMYNFATTAVVFMELNAVNYISDKSDGVKNK